VIFAQNLSLKDLSLPTFAELPTANGWAQQQWSMAELGDERRTRRAIALAAVDCRGATAASRDDGTLGARPAGITISGQATAGVLVPPAPS